MKSIPSAFARLQIYTQLMEAVSTTVIGRRQIPRAFSLELRINRLKLRARSAGIGRNPAMKRTKPQNPEYQ
jgi:hypothetical protein